MIEPVVERLEELSGGDTSFQIELIHIFLAETEKNLRDIDRYVSEENYAQASRSAHAVKGAALNIGSRELGQLLESLEHHLSRGEKVSQALQEFHAAYSVFHTQLTEFLAQLQ